MKTIIPMPPTPDKSWEKRFLTLWVGQSVSVLTSAIVQMSLVWYLTSKTQSAAVMSTGTLMGFIPRAVIGPFAGVFIDKLSKKKVMISADLFIAAISLVPVFYGLFYELPIWMVMVILFCRSLGSAFHTPALQAATPLIVPKNELTQYAGFAQGFESASHLISPAVAAVLFGMFELNAIMLLDVCGALFAVFMLGFVNITDMKKSGVKQHRGYFSEFADGLLIVKKDAVILFVVVVGCLYSMIYSPIGTYYPLITMTHFGGSVEDSALVETVLSFGTLCGALLLGIIGGRIDKMRFFTLSIFTYGLGLIIAGVIPGSWLIVFVVVSAVIGASIPFYSSVRTSIIQIRVLPEYLGRVFSLISSVTTFTTPLGLICAGIFAEKVGIARWFFCSGVAVVILAIASAVILRIKGGDEK